MNLCNSKILPLALPELGTRAKVPEQIRISREPNSVPRLRLHAAIAEVRLNLSRLSSEELIDEVSHPRWIQCDGQKVGGH